MSIERFVVSADPVIYHAWPDIALTRSERMLCVFCECTHHGDRSYSRVVMVESDDRGRTWSKKRPISEAIDGDGTVFWDCPRITRLKDGRVAIICTRVYGHMEAKGENFLWMGDAEGRCFDGPLNLGIEGIVPDRLLETASGRWIIACHTGNVDGLKNLQQRLYYSDDQGGKWCGPVTVGRDERYNLCEASIIETSPGTLVCLMRENSRMGIECTVARSDDNGETWGKLYTIPLDGCHRPVAGFLDTGEVMVTYRYRPGTQRGWLGSWTQNTFLCITDARTLLARDRADQAVRIMPLHYDRSAESDLGYTGWVQFSDGEIYIVDYIRDDAPKCKIIASALRREDIGGLA